MFKSEQISDERVIFRPLNPYFIPLDSASVRLSIFLWFLLGFIISFTDYVKASRDFCCNTNVDTSCIRLWSMQEICFVEHKDEQLPSKVISSE